MQKRKRPETVSTKTGPDAVKLFLHAQLSSAEHEISPAN